MRIIATTTGPVTIAAFEGRLDTLTTPNAEDALLPLVKQGSVVANFEAVGYVSSTGLRLLLKAAKLAKASGHSFSVCALQPLVREVIEISGFEKIIPIYASQADALAAG